MSDLIILAGTTALEKEGGITIPFCSVGRVDLKNRDEGWKHLKPRIRGVGGETVEVLKDYISVMGLTLRQFSALLGAGYSMGESQQCDGLFCQRNSFSSGGSQPRNLTNIFFTDLLSNQKWESVRKSGRAMFKAEGKEIFM